MEWKFVSAVLNFVKKKALVWSIFVKEQNNRG